MCVVWALLLIIFLQNPKNHKNIYLSLEEVDLSCLKLLDNQPGLIEWYINQTENVAIIKYDDTLIQKDQILSVLHKG